eukprot:Skav208839  [mRNA]  locus=scaffold1193:177041:181282:+ [translate_table: standard]
MFCFLIRIGEACNPGPVDCALGVANPSGLRGKTLSVLDLPYGLWNFSETQCTDLGFRSVAGELRAFQQPRRNLRIEHGCFAPPRAGSVSAGSWTGVAQCSDFPLRRLCIPWRGHEWDSGRTLVSSFQIGSQCVIGAVVYAPPLGPTYPNASMLTAELLATLTEEIVLGQTGPRFIAGDFNTSSQGQAAFMHWRSLGWSECQEIALARFDRQPTPTCKNSTSPDQIWLSPELQRWMTGVQCHDDIFADHAVLYTQLTVPTDLGWQHTWFQPAALPWDSVDPATLSFEDQCPHQWDNANLTHSFKVWSEQAEGELISKVAPTLCHKRSMTGRGATTRVTKRPNLLVPIAPGRCGDVTPRSSLLGRLVHQWFRQLRRLQAYSRRAQSSSSAPALQVDQLNTWRSILSAPGFLPSFQSWWSQRSVRLHGSPEQFPRYPPTAAVSKQLFMDFEANFRALERWHLAQRTKVLHAKHQHHNQILYKQLRAQKAGSVSHLRKSMDFTIAIVHSADQVELDRPVPSLPACQWTLNGSTVDVKISEDPSVVAVDSDQLLLVGQVLHASCTLTDFEDLESELHALWNPLWMRHAGVANSHWDRIIAFGRAYLTPGACAGPVWTAGHFRQVIRSYKRRATRGPDAWDRLDLLALSDVRLADLCNLFVQVESNVQWPVQLTTGFVCPVAKCADPDLATHYRPIVLISLLYRLWASSSSKHFLPFLCQRIAPHIFGYVQGRRASDMWGLVQLSLEVSRLSSQPLTGFCADLVKCFNLLARFPLFELLEFLGLSSGTVTAWKNALGSLERRFRLLHDVGPAHLSATGFPEGDPLSCVAMLCFNSIFDQYIKQFAPGCVGLAFVDNLQILSDLAGSLQPGILVMQTFLDAWDLMLDPKSYTWSTDSKQRGILRAFGHTVLLNSKDLGSQMHYAGVTSRKVLSQRLAAVSHYWGLLRASSAHAWFKIQAIRAAAWPKVLHGCESAWISQSTMDSLRSKCMQALKWDRAGANPVVRWALMLPLGYDPSFVQVWSVLSSFWRLCRLFPYVREVWCSFGYLVSSPQGILHSVHSALNLLSWTLDDQWNLYVSHFVLDWLTLSLESLRILVGHCWQQHMASCLPSRLDFHSLDSLDVTVSFSSFKAGNQADCELVATIQDGTFFVNKMKAKWDSSKQADCPRCNVPDTLRHRCLECPLYAAVREGFPSQVANWDQQSRAFTEHGLVPANPFLLEHWRFLLELDDCQEQFHFQPTAGGHYELFTDGTCSHPQSKLKRLAAWAVIGMDDNRIISRGPVQGLIQSIDVAELTAVCSAMRWALKYAVSICVHSDSQYVVDGLSFLRLQNFVPKHWKHQSIWLSLHEVMQQLEMGQWWAHKVYSHADISTASTSLEEWWISGNDKADKAALAANEDRSADFWRNSMSRCAPTTMRNHKM